MNKWVAETLVIIKTPFHRRVASENDFKRFSIRDRSKQTRTHERRSSRKVSLF